MPTRFAGRSITALDAPYMERTHVLPDMAFAVMKAMNLYMVKSRPTAEVRHLWTLHQLRPLRLSRLDGFHF